MARDLFDMNIDEISLVDDPANDDARVVIVKMKGEGFKPCKDCSGSVTPTCKANGKCLLEGKGGSLMKKFSARLAELANEFSPEMVEKAFAGSDPADMDAATTAAVFLKEIVMDIEQLSKALTDAEAKIDTLTQSVAKAAADHETVVKAKDAEITALKETIAKATKKPEAEAEEFLKSLPEAVRKQLEDGKAAREEVAKLRQEREEAEAIEKAKALKVGDAKALGPILLRVEKGQTTAEDRKSLEAVLKQAGELAERSALFKSFGSDVAVDGDPEAMLTVKADEIRKANKTLTAEQAYSQACDENPHLYTAYIAKRRSGGAVAN